MKSKSLKVVLTSIGALAMGLSFLVVWLNYDALPATIPQHFNGAGEPDGYGPKSGLLLLPCIGTVLFIVISFIHKLPRTFINYPYKITPENEARQYNNTMTMLTFLGTLLPLVFLYLTYFTVQTALGKAAGLGTNFTIVFLSLTAGILVFFIYRGYKLR